MSIDRIIMLCAGCAIGIFGCVGLFYIGKKIERLDKTISEIQYDVHRMQVAKDYDRHCMSMQHSMSIRLTNLLEKVTVGRNKVTDEEEC